jgi:hypothetical protein
MGFYPDWSEYTIHRRPTVSPLPFSRVELGPDPVMLFDSQSLSLAGCAWITYQLLAALMTTRVMKFRSKIPMFVVGFDPAIKVFDLVVSILDVLDSPFKPAHNTDAEVTKFSTSAKGFYYTRRYTPRDYQCRHILVSIAYLYIVATPVLLAFTSTIIVVVFHHHSRCLPRPARPSEYQLLVLPALSLALFV